MASLTIISVALCAVIGFAVYISGSLTPLWGIIIIFLMWCGFEMDFK